MNPNSISTSPLSASSGIPADAISQRAYELWEQDGRPDGCDMRHWLQAEQELSARQSTPAQPTHTSGNGAPSNGSATSPVSSDADVRPLQGTRAASAAARDPKRAAPPAPAATAKPPAPTPAGAGRRK